MRINEDFLEGRTFIIKTQNRNEDSNIRLLKLIKNQVNLVFQTSQYVSTYILQYKKIRNY